MLVAIVILVIWYIASIFEDYSKAEYYVDVIETALMRRGQKPKIEEFENKIKELEKKPTENPIVDIEGTIEEQRKRGI